MKSRSQALQNIARTTFDVCVIGGGAVGAGCALDAQLRGLKTVILEAGDFAGATSGSSTKLAHGGVRYLQKAVSDRNAGQYRVVKLALRERRLMLDNAPFLTHPLEFLVPCPNFWEICYYGLGMKLYDWMAGSESLSPSRRLSREECVARMPLLNASKLAGAIAYSDGQFDDSRFNVALIQTFAAAGGEATNYLRVIGFRKDPRGKLAEALVQDQKSGTQFPVSAKVFVNATGPFSDGIRRLAQPGIESRLRLSKGVHILFPLDAAEGSDSLLVPKTEDGRVIFAIPWLGRLLVGTTDDEVNPGDDLAVKRSEVEYLLRQLNRYLVRPLSPEQVVSGFAGLRPLVKVKGSRDTKDLIRDHEVEIERSSGLISVLGGKWTTYRAMAEDAVNAAQQSMGIAVSKCRTANYPLKGSEGWEPNYWKTLAAKYGVSSQTARHLSAKFGTSASSILEIAAERPQLRRPLYEGFPAIQAEVVYCARKEMATTIEDVLARRLGLQWFSWKQAMAAAPIAGSLLAEELGWSREEAAFAVAQYVGRIASFMDAIGLVRYAADGRQSQVVNC